MLAHGGAGGEMGSMVGWVARLVCVADSYNSLKCVLCAEHFYYVSCLYQLFSLRVVFELYMYVYNRAPCWVISMNL